MKRLSLLEKKILIISIVLIVVILISFIALMNKSNAKQTLAENIEDVMDIKDLIINEEQIEDCLVGEYQNLNEIEENEKQEENKDEDKNKNTQNNTTVNTSNNNQANTMPYYIKVNYGAQVVTIYKKDEQGNYTVPVKAMVCSTGAATPKSGVYKIQYRWEWLRLEGYVYGHYSTQIVGNILFHSVPYLSKDPSTLEYWEYDKLGTYASAGCVRLKASDALWIYNNCARGTRG